MATSRHACMPPGQGAALHRRSGIIMVLKTSAPPWSGPMRLRLRHLDVAEHHASGAAAARTHEPVEILHLDARAAIDDHRADTHVRRRIVREVGPDVGEKEIRAFRADDEALHAADDEIVAVVFCPAAGAEEVRAAARLGQRLG